MCDSNRTLLSVSATEDQDGQAWAEMLLRMYRSWAERNAFTVENTEASSLTITGELAYARLQSEVGVHRLTRISPFDPEARRTTSFANVVVSLSGQREDGTLPGTVIRAYVTHPYQQVSDYRTGFKCSDVEAVLGGDLDAFMDAVN